MSEERVLQLNLTEADARVLSTALGILPLIANARTLQAMLEGLSEQDDKRLIVLAAAQLAGAKRLSRIDDEMNMQTLRDNMKRGYAIIEQLFTWLGTEHGHDSN